MRASVLRGHAMWSACAEGVKGVPCLRDLHHGLEHEGYRYAAASVRAATDNQDLRYYRGRHQKSELLMHANQQSHRNAARVHLSTCLPLARSAAPYAHGQQDDYFRECLRHVSRTQSGSSCDPAAPDKTRNQTDPRSPARHSPVVPQMRIKRERHSALDRKRAN